MEHTIILKSGQKVEVLLQDEVSLDIDCSLRYIKSGQKEIANYIDNTAKPKLAEVITQAQENMDNQIATGIEIAKNAAALSAQNTIDASIENAESEISAYVNTVLKPDLDLAVEQASASAESAVTSKEQAEQFLEQISAKNTAFNLNAETKLEEFESLSADVSANMLNARNWAIGNIDEVPEGSSKYWAVISKGTAQISIGDIGFAPLGIDETLNLRRYLNGQIISQSQFVSFTTKVKNAVALNPNLATTETNWQATVTNSPYGICDKFVIDNIAETIRLPKYPEWGVREVGQAPVIGDGNRLGVTFSNMSGTYHPKSYKSYEGCWGGNEGQGDPAYAVNGSISTDPTKSGMISDLVNATTEDRMVGKWFIQVAIGVEESIDVSKEIQLNNPFSLLDYKWSEYEITNVSWLLSNGSFYSGATYPAVFQLLQQIKNETITKAGVSVKLSTETYTDYDFVINTTDTTFRLPVKVKLASGNAVAGNGMTLGLTDGTNTGGLLSTDINENKGRLVGKKGIDGTMLPATTAQNSGGFNTSSVLGITPDPTKSGIETSSQGLKLYFYVGETVQDANVINATGILSRVAELSNEYIVGLSIPDYSAGVNITTGNFTPPCDGIIKSAATNKSNDIKVIYGDVIISECYVNSTYPTYSLDTIPVLKGETYTITISGTKSANCQEMCVFYPFKGAN